MVGLLHEVVELKLHLIQQFQLQVTKHFMLIGLLLHPQLYLIRMKELQQIQQVRVLHMVLHTDH